MKLPARFRFALALTAAALAGCAALDVYQTEPARSHRAQGLESPAGVCAALFEVIDRAVDGSEVRDALASRIAGFPYLRASRFLASFAGEPLSDAAFDAWVARLRRLDDEARSVELANLPRAAREALIDALPARFRAAPLEGTRECAKLLERSDLSGEAGRTRLRAAATVPPDYDEWKRAVGVYPLTRIPFAAGVRNYQARTREMFATEQPLAGRRVRYALQRTKAASAAEIAEILARGDPLGVAEPGEGKLESLFAAYAPEFEIDEADENDRLGALAYGKDGARGRAAPARHARRDAVRASVAAAYRGLGPHSVARRLAHPLLPAGPRQRARRRRAAPLLVRLRRFAALTPRRGRPP